MLKLGGFVGSLAAGAALVGSAVTGTGAYFSDSHTGSLSGSSGHLTLNTTDTNLSFSDLVPGDYQTKNIDYNVNASGKSDVWLVFDPTSQGYLAFTGAKNNPSYPDGGLGRYGHFAVSVNGASPLFQSYNLALPTASTDPSCTVDAYGNGGSAQQPTSRTDTIPYCGVPSAIRIAAGLSSGQGGTLNLTFGVTGRWTGQNTPVANVPFTLVATQTGHRPGEANF